MAANFEAIMEPVPESKIPDTVCVKFIYGDKVSQSGRSSHQEDRWPLRLSHQWGWPEKEEIVRLTHGVAEDMRSSPTQVIHER